MKIQIGTCPPHLQMSLEEKNCEWKRRAHLRRKRPRGTATTTLSIVLHSPRGTRTTLLDPIWGPRRKHFTPRKRLQRMKVESERSSGYQGDDVADGSADSGDSDSSDRSSDSNFNEDEMDWKSSSPRSLLREQLGELDVNIPELAHEKVTTPLPNNPSVDPRPAKRRRFCSFRSESTRIGSEVARMGS